MEYYEDLFEFEQAQNREYCSYCTLDIDGVEYVRGTYEDCVEERDYLLSVHSKDGLRLSDCTIQHHCCTI